MMAALSEADACFVFDVFVSVRSEKEDEEDPLLNSFVCQLCAVLQEHGIRQYCTYDRRLKGDGVPDMLRAVEKSEILIPIFSRSYAECKICLMVVAKMVECRRLILPIFYDVEPRQVRNIERGPFDEAFGQYEDDKDLDREVVKQWKDALREAGEIKGYDVQTEVDDGQVQKLIPLIIRRVLDGTSKIPLDVAKYPVGLDSRVNHIMKLLDLDSHKVGVVGIHGMGGIGKTTIATAAYNKISRRFEASCFMPNIKEVAKQVDGLLSLQRQLISEVLNDKHASINSVSQGINLIKRRIHSKRVLLVLDDVDDNNQLNALAGNESWFSRGSRVIITTRDKHILNVHRVKDSYELEKLNRRQSLRLFSFHAFGRPKPMTEFAELSETVVTTADGLPLTLEVFGSYFFYKHTAEEWEEAVDRLKREQHKDVHERLKISYDGLDETEKKIFLDIACFFSEKGKEYAIYMWKDCEFFPNISLKVLWHKSLIKLDGNKNEFQMHDQIRDMGRYIVLQEVGPELRSRLWNDDEILQVLHNHKATNNTEGITLTSEWYSPTTYLDTEAFKAMPNLRLLHVNAAEFDGDFCHISGTLKWLQWHGCMLDSLPHDLNIERLVVLDLWRSSIKKVCDFHGKTNKQFDKLKVLNLAHCSHLKSVPDFSNFPCLVKLMLDDCYSMPDLGESIKHLKNLEFLSVKRCERLKELPSSIVQLSSLRFLILEGCTFVNTLPDQLGEMTSLKELNFRGTMITRIPESFGRLDALEVLDLRQCIALYELPNSTGCARNLRKIYLDETDILELPDSIGQLQNLEELKASWCRNLKCLPGSIVNAANLKSLLVEDTAIRELPEDIGLLRKLEILKASFCERLRALPPSIVKLHECVVYIDHTGIEEIPDSIKGACNLTIMADRKEKGK